MNFLYALDAATGNRSQRSGKMVESIFVAISDALRKQSVALNEPGIVYKDLIIVGGRNPETLPAAPGDVRA